MRARASAKMQEQQEAGKSQERPGPGRLVCAGAPTYSAQAKAEREQIQIQIDPPGAAQPGGRRWPPSCVGPYRICVGPALLWEGTGALPGDECISILIIIDY
jgi:hypothetical protein